MNEFLHDKHSCVLCYIPVNVLSLLVFVLWLVQSLFTAVAKATNTQLQDNISSCLNNMFNVSSEVLILEELYTLIWNDS